jgi:hypothetical protein
MNLIDDCETSLQVLRGFETDITAEMNDIKARLLSFPHNWTFHNLDIWLYVPHYSGISGIICSFDFHYAESSEIITQKDYNPLRRVKPKEIPHSPNSNFLNFWIIPNQK